MESTGMDNLPVTDQQVRDAEIEMAEVLGYRVRQGDAAPHFATDPAATDELRDAILAKGMHLSVFSERHHQEAVLVKINYAPGRTVHSVSLIEYFANHQNSRRRAEGYALCKTYLWALRQLAIFEDKRTDAERERESV